MEYNVYLKFDAELDLNLNDLLGGLLEDCFADIMYETNDPVNDDIDEWEDHDYEGTKIGFMKWFVYNQALAKEYGAHMDQTPYLTLQYNSKALLELDYTNISQETIDKIGATTNPNILVLHHFGISAAWRNKGIGEQVLKGLIKQMKGKCGYIMILHSEPVQCGDHTGPDSLYEVQGVELAGLEKDPEKAQWKLNAFFQRCGFRQYKNYDNVFVCNVDQVVASEPRVAKHPVIRFT
jgi:hypothetical protein